jgi:hypothetical protein
MAGKGKGVATAPLAVANLQPPGNPTLRVMPAPAYAARACDARSKCGEEIRHAPGAVSVG